MPQPLPIVAFFQPKRNIPAMMALGVNTFAGPEVEDAKQLPPATLAAKEAEWIDAVKAAGAKCILKRPPDTLPDNCVGILLSPDEPNRDNKGPTDSLRLEAAGLRTRYPGVPLYLSLAGDKILSANFDRDWEAQVYHDYATLYDFAFTNFYERNRNANRYPDTFSGDIVKKLTALTGKPVIPFLEPNDQQLQPPPKAPDISRAPSPLEIKLKADHAVNMGAAGIGWFFTSRDGKYRWPDSYFPQVDRNGVSMSPQYEMVRQINVSLAPPSPSADPVTELRDEVRRNHEAVMARIDELRKAIDAPLVRQINT